MTADFLIIGQGLAGSLLAWELLQREARVIIVDNGRENASQVAAGLINPVTGMRLVKSNDVDTLLPVAKDYYAQLGYFFKETFYIEKPMLRIFRSPKELAQAGKRLNNPEYKNYLEPIQQKPLYPLASPLGFLPQKQTGFLLTKPLLSQLKKFFIANNSYRQAEILPQAIQLSPTLQWQDISPNYIIFAEGYLAAQNPYFSWLPWQLAKGEILTLAHSLNLPDIINYGNWLIPLENSIIRVGASFDVNNLNTETTAQARNSLLDALKPLNETLSQATLINQQANIRPCTLDKQPFIGFHPQHSQLAIFNGFGSKGSLQIPMLCQQFADTLLNGTKLPGQCSIERCYRRLA